MYNTPARGASPAPTDLGMSVPRRGLSELRSPSAQAPPSSSNTTNNNNNNNRSPSPPAAVPLSAATFTPAARPAGLPPLALTSTRLAHFNRLQQQQLERRQRHHQHAGAGRTSENGSERGSSSSGSSNRSNGSGILDALTNKVSSVRRSVSRAWNTFSATHFSNDDDNINLAPAAAGPALSNSNNNSGSGAGTHEAHTSPSRRSPPQHLRHSMTSSTRTRSYNAPAVKRYRRQLMERFGIKAARNPASPLDTDSDSSCDDEQQQQQQQQNGFSENGGTSKRSNNNSSGGHHHHSSSNHHVETRSVDDLKEYYVDKRFWAPSFQAGRAELEALPQLTTEREVKGEMIMLDVLSKDRTMQARAVNSVLKQRLLENFETFNDGMEHVSIISSDLEETAAACRAARAKLLHLKTSFVLRGLMIPRLAQRKERMEQVRDVLETLEMMLLRDREMKTLIKEGRFREAVELSKTGDIFASAIGGGDGHSSHTQQHPLLKGIKAAEVLEQNWQFMCSTLLQQADAAWDACFARGTLDMARYEDICEAHAMARGGQAGKVAAQVCATVTGATMRGLVAASASKNVKDVQQLVLGIEPSFLVVTISQVAARITDGVATCLQVEAFHQKRIAELQIEVGNSIIGGGAGVGFSGGNGGGGFGSREMSPSLLHQQQHQQQPQHNSARRATSVQSSGGSNSNINNLSLAAVQAAAAHHRSISRGYFKAGDSFDNLPNLYEALAHHPSPAPARNRSGVPPIAGLSAAARAVSVPLTQQQQQQHPRATSVPASQSHPSSSSLSQQHHQHHHYESSGVSFGSSSNNSLGMSNANMMMMMGGGGGGGGSFSHFDAETQILIEKGQSLTFHREVLSTLQTSMARAGEEVQRQLLTLADALVLSGGSGGLGLHQQLPIDRGLHIFYILAMAVESAAHLGGSKDSTTGKRDSMRAFAKQLVESELYLRGCRSIVEDMVRDTWQPLQPRAEAMRDLITVTGITPVDYRADRDAIADYVIPEEKRKLQKEQQREKEQKSTSSANVSRQNTPRAGKDGALVASSSVGQQQQQQQHQQHQQVSSQQQQQQQQQRTNPFLETRMLQRVSGESTVALDGLGTEQVQLDDLHPTVCRSTASVARLFYNLARLAVARFPPLASEMQDWAGNIASMYIYLIGWSMVGSGAESRLQQHDDFAPAAKDILGTVEKWARNVYEEAFKGQSITIRVNCVSLLSSLALPAGTAASTVSPGRARFHFEDHTPAARAGSVPQQSQPQLMPQPAAQHHGTTIDVQLTEQFPPPVFAAIKTSYENRYAFYAIKERLTALDACRTMIKVLRQNYDSVGRVLSGAARDKQERWAQDLQTATDHLLHVGCHRLLLQAIEFPFSDLADRIASSRWDTTDYNSAASKSAMSNPTAAAAAAVAAAAAGLFGTSGGASQMYVAPAAAAGRSNDPRANPLPPSNANTGGGSKYKLCEWVNDVEILCANFFRNVALQKQLKFESAHLLNVFWRRFIFEIQRAIVSGFARSGRATEAVVHVMRAEVMQVQHYLNGIFKNGRIFVRERHVLDFLDAFSLNRAGRQRWLVDNHEFYSWSSLTEWFVTLHSGSLSPHDMNGLMFSLKHIDCVLVVPFLAKELEDEQELKRPPPPPVLQQS